MVNPRPIAPKPAPPKTSYTTPAVIAKPVVKSSGGYSGIPTLTAANKPVTGGKSSNQAAIDAANKKLLSDQKLLNDLLGQYVAGNTGGSGGGGGGGGDTIINPGNRSDASYIEEGRSGTSNTGKRYIEGRLVSESEWNTFLNGDSKSDGGNKSLTPTTPERTLALDTFKATLGLLFGKDEVGKAYVAKLYSLVSGFYKTGSEVDEAINLALYQAESENAIPEFTSRFKGIFALRDAKQKGAAISVPTIAEFFATEAKMGEVLTGAGLGDLATESFLGDVIGKQKSVNEVASLIGDVFNTIDYAPKELKATLSTYFPGVDRVSIARAILTGPEGAQALSQKIKGVSVLSAGAQYGIPVDLATATDIANRGFDYNSALAGFGQVSSLGRAGELARMSGGDFTQAQAQSAVFYKDSANLAQLSKIKEVEENRFASQVGNVKGSYSTGYLSKSSSSGQF
jgi:hypothetical protein